MANDGRTEWFRLVDHQPVREGWYECSEDDQQQMVYKRYWDGRAFFTNISRCTRFSPYWRGLTLEAYGRQRFNMQEDARVTDELARKGLRGPKIERLHTSEREPFDLPPPKTWDEFKRDEQTRAPKHVQQACSDFIFGKRVVGMRPEHAAPYGSAKHQLSDLAIKTNDAKHLWAELRYRLNEALLTLDKLQKLTQ
jgi:hypothetical protein